MYRYINMSVFVLERSISLSNVARPNIPFDSSQQVLTNVGDSPGSVFTLLLSVVRVRHYNWSLPAAWMQVGWAIRPTRLSSPDSEPDSLRFRVSRLFGARVLFSLPGLSFCAAEPAGARCSSPGHGSRGAHRPVLAGAVAGVASVRNHAHRDVYRARVRGAF